VPGSYEVSASAPGYAPATRIATTASAVDIALERGASIVGRVVAASGRPVTACRVTTRRVRSAAFAEGDETRDVADADGRFRIQELQAGSYRLTIAAEGTGGAEIPQILVRPGVDVDLGDILLGAPARIFGTVRDSGGSPISGASVIVGRAAAFGGLSDASEAA